MARRHPILSVVGIVLIIVALVHFSRSFDASASLAHVQKLVPDEDPATAHAGETRHGAADAPDAGHSSTDHSGSQKGEQPAAAFHDELAVGSSAPSLDDLAAGKPIMAKMPNQTIRAQVGNAGWKLLHTILAQYPEEPTAEDRQTLGTFLKFFSRVYPCRECAEHFQELLQQHPPQLSSRKAAAMWGCDAHNKVNKRLGKEIFDCAYIFDKYDCGCGSQEEGSADAKGADAKGANEVGAAAEKTDVVPLVRGG